MPQLELSPELSLYYEIVPSKAENPWLLLLHPILTDLLWMKSLTDRPDIRKSFNCISFDQRSHGRTQSPISLTIDVHTLAADLAMAMQKLKLPPVRQKTDHL